MRRMNWSPVKRRTVSRWAGSQRVLGAVTRLAGHSTSTQTLVRDSARDRPARFDRATGCPRHPPVTCSRMPGVIGVKDGCPTYASRHLPGGLP